MRQKTMPSLVQIMACRLFDPKPLYEPMPAYHQPDFLWISNVFTQKNAFENAVCKIMAIVSRPQSVHTIVPKNVLHNDKHRPTNVTVVGADSLALNEHQCNEQPSY